MLWKLSLLAFAIMAPFNGVGAVAATNLASPTLLRGDNHPKQARDPTNNNILMKLLERVDALEIDVEVLKADNEMLKADNEYLEATVYELQQQQESRHRNLGIDSRCDIIFQNGVCRANNTFAFNFDVEFDGPVQANDGLKVNREFQTTGPALLTRGADISGGLITLDSRLTFGNITIDGLNIIGKTIFNDPIEVLDQATFSDAVEFNGHEEVEFNVDVTFREDVYFKEDVEFLDDVTIMGPSSSDDSTDFEVMGYVNVDFKQKIDMNVYPETNFREDVHLIQGSDSSSTSTSSSGKSKSSDDYSSDSHDHAPQLKVEGDITTESDLKVEGDLHVGGDTTFTGTTTFESNLLVDGGNVEILSQDPVDDDLVPPGGDLIVGGLTTLQGGITGGLIINDGNLQVATGGATIDQSLRVNEGGIDVIGPSTIIGDGVANGLTVSAGTININGLGAGADALTVNNGNVQVNGDLTATGTITP